MGYIGLVFMIIAYELVKPRESHLHCHLVAVPIFILSTHEFKKKFIDLCSAVECFESVGGLNNQTIKSSKAHNLTQALTHSLHCSIKDHLKASETISRVTTYHRLAHTHK
jgi:hypothetical protein